MSTYDLVADLPLHDRGLRRSRASRRTSPATSSASRRSSTCTAPARRASARTSSTTPSTTRSPSRPGPTLPLAGDWTLALVLRAPRDARPLPRDAPARGVAAVPRLGLRVGGAGPRAAPGRPAAARGARPRAAAADLRRLAAPRRAADAGARSRGAWSATRRCASSSTRRRRGTPTLIAELVATGAVDSVDFKGLYEGTLVDNPADPELYLRVVDAFPDAWIEDPKLTPEIDALLEPAPRPHHLGREHPLDRRHRGAAVRAADGQPQAVAPGRHQPLFDAYDYTRRAAASAPTAAASSSSASGAATSSTSRRSSIPTRRTTRRRRAFTSWTRRPACRRAR